MKTFANALLGHRIDRKRTTAIPRRETRRARAVLVTWLAMVCLNFSGTMPVLGQTPSSTDLWDVSQGVSVTAHSPLDPSDGTSMAYDIHNVFGATGGTYFEGALGLVIFDDHTLPDFAHYVDWATPAPVTIGFIRLFARGDTPATHREFKEFRLWAKTPGSVSFDQLLYSFTPDHPYLLIDEDNDLLIEAEISPVTAQEFRAEFTTWEGASASINGPRIIELDGFAERPCAPQPSGMVGWWRGEGNALDTQGGNDGFAIGGVTYAGGKVGLAANLNGVDQFVELANTPDLNPSGSFTIEAWILPATDQVSAIFAKWGDEGDYSNQRSYVLNLHPGRKLQFAISDEARQLDGDFHSFGSDDDAITVGDWNHVAGVYDQVTGARRLYVNGVKVAERIDPPITVLNGLAKASIGGHLRSSTAAQFFFAGLIDEVALYHRALTEPEIQAIYNADAAGKCTESIPACAPQPSGAVSWWRGEGNAADSVGDVSGIVHGGVSYVPGMVGQAFSFDGQTGYVELPGVFGGGTEYTVEAWVRSAEDTGGFQAIVSSTATEEFLHFQLSDAGNSAVYCFPPGPVYFNALSPAPYGVWRHVALSIRSGDSRLYVDGQLIEQQSTTFDHILPTDSLRIGCGFNGGRFFKGEIDELSIFNRALTETEIQAIYNAGAAGKCTESTPPCAPAPSDLVGWWPGEGNVLDAQGDNDGILVGGVTYAAGKVGQAFQLNGTDAVVEIPDDPSLQLTGPITVEAWINPAQVTVGTIASKYDSSIFEPSWAFLILQGQLRFSVIGPDASTYRYADTADPVVATDVFSHVAATFDPVTQEIKIYVNGTSVLAPVGADSSIVPTLLASTAPVRLGRFIESSGPSANWFNGLIDEFAMYDRVLSSAEIQAIYNAGAAGKCIESDSPCDSLPGLLNNLEGYWPFNGNGADGSGLSRDLLLEGGVGFDNGLFGQAFNLPRNNSQYAIRPGDDSAYNFGGSDFTVQVWVNFNSTSGEQVMIEKFTGGGGPGWTLTKLSGNSLQFYGSSGGSLTLGTSISEDEWHQFVARRADGTLTLFHNGVPLGGTGLGVIPDSVNPLLIGRRNSGDGRDFSLDGRLDEVGIWRRGLSDQEIACLYNSGLGRSLEDYATPPCIAPLITAQPTSQTVCPNTEVTFIVLATGSGLSYQWLKDGADLLGETDTFLIINPVQAAHAGQYRVRVQNTCGVELSAMATLNVVDTPPAISLNGSASITVEACTGYSNPGASALDDCDGILPVSDDSNTVNTSVPYVYVVTYSATDSSQQTTTAIRTVTVLDTVAPEFVMVPDDLTLDCSDPDKETKIQSWLASVTASDTCGTATVENNFGALGACDAGSRIVKWTASDGHGNSVEVTRTLAITADGLLNELTFDASPLQITLSPNEQGQVTFQAVNAGEYPILIQSGSVTGPEFGPLVTLPEDVLPVTLCPGDSLNLVLDVDTTDVVPGIAPHAYVLTLLGQNDDSIEVQLEVSVVEGGQPDLTANQPGGGVTIVHAGSPFPPGANDPFTIRATLFNIGTLDASEFKVRFFDGSELLGVVTVSGLATGATTPVEWPVLSGRSQGFYQFRIQILSPDEGEVTLANNETSTLVQVGAFPPGTATLVVRANALPACGFPTSVFITGTAEYEIVSSLGTVRYPVKGGQVILTVVDGATVNAGHTLVDGTFSGYVPALTEGNYTVIASVTDTTLIGQDEMTYAIPALNCPEPGGVVEQTGEISPKLPYATRNLFICNGDFFVRLPDCTTPVVAGSVAPGLELCLGINVHYFEINGKPIPEQPVYLTAYEQLNGQVIPHPIPGTAVSFVGGGSAEARFKWTPPHAGIFILQAQLNPTFPQGIEDDTATTTLVVGSPAEGATDIRVTAQGANLCGALYQNVSGRAVYTAQPGDIRPAICGDVIVRGYVLDNNPDDPGTPQLIGVATGSTDRFGNFSIAPRIQFPPGNHLLVVEVSDGTLTGQYTIDVYCEPPPPPGEPSPDTPPTSPLDVYVYSEDIGFLGADCQSPLNRWPLPGETISLAANIHYYGPSPEPALPVDVNVLVPVGNQLIRQFIGRVAPVDWSQGGFLCLPWTPQILGPQIVEVATRPDLVPLDQFTDNDAATRLIFVGEVDCQLTAEPDRTTIEAGEMAEVSLTATRVSGEGGMELSVIYAGEGDVPPGMEVLLSSTPIAFSETVTFSVQTTEDVPPGLYRFILLGNGDTCQALAMVNVRVVQTSDTTAPIISCPADLVVQCEADVPLPDVDSVEATDDPGPAPEVVHVGDEVSSLPTSTVILRTYRATDAAGNSAECVQTITVQDTTPPAITCPQPVIVAADASCQAILPDLRNDSVISDACTAAPDITVSQVPEPNTLLGLGEHLVTLTATDAAGNSASCTTTVTVRDETSPSIVCPASVTLVADANCQAVVPDLAARRS